MNPRLLWGAATFGAGSAAAAICLTRRLAERSGATTSEAHSALPGDDLVPNPQIQTTRAITIHAPVADVWPWVAQLGYHRGGWYTNARLDKLLWRIDNPSADHVLPECQHLEIGDTVPDGPEGTARFTVAAITPGRLLALHDPDGTHIPQTDFSWTFVLQAERRWQHATDSAHARHLSAALVDDAARISCSRPCRLLHGACADAARDQGAGRANDSR